MYKAIWFKIYTLTEVGRVKRITVPLFNIDVLLYTGDKGRKAIEKDAGTKVSSTALGCVSGSSVWFKDAKPSVNSVAHEASHLAYEITTHIGVKDEETRAYITGFVTQEICKYLKII